MSSLLGLLNLGAGALQAQNTGVAVASNNAANVNTIGYSRQRADLSANRAAPLVGGVSSGDPTRMASDLLSGRRRDNADQFGLATAMTEILSALEGRLITPGNDLTAPLADLFGRINEMATTPGDIQVRDSVVAASNRVADAFNRQASVISQAQNDADAQLSELTASANVLSAQIATLNRDAGIATDPVVQDQRDQAALQLAELVGGNARVDADGQMRFVLPGGEVLVDGMHASQLNAVPQLGGFTRLVVVDGNHSRDVTALLDGGTAGGLLEFRDRIAVQATADLDQLAFDFATQINAVHRANAGLDGISGRDLFVEPATVDGAAARFELDPVIAADASLLAAAGAGAGVGDNQGALQLGTLRDELLAVGKTRSFIGESIHLVTSVGQHAASSAASLDLYSARRDNLDGLRDSISGVSIQEEMVRLSQFQHAAQAATRFISTVDEMLADLLARF